MNEQRGHRGSSSAMSTYVRQDGHAVARIKGCGDDRLRFPAEDEEDEVDADEVDDVAGEAVVLPAAARSRAERTMSRVQTAAELAVAAAAAGVGRLRSWWPPCTLGWRGVRNVLPDCQKINKDWVKYILQKKFVLETDQCIFRKRNSSWKLISVAYFTRID